MKVQLNTFRYGQETSLLYHGESCDYNEETAVLTLHKPVQESDGSTGFEHVITMVPGDDFLVFPCHDCDVHRDSDVQIYGK